MVNITKYINVIFINTNHLLFMYILVASDNPNPNPKQPRSYMDLMEFKWFNRLDAYNRYLFLAKEYSTNLDVRALIDKGMLSVNTDEDLRVWLLSQVGGVNSRSKFSEYNAAFLGEEDKQEDLDDDLLKHHLFLFSPTTIKQTNTGDYYAKIDAFVKPTNVLSQTLFDFGVYRIHPTRVFSKYKISSSSPHHLGIVLHSSCYKTYETFSELFKDHGDVEILVTFITFDDKQIVCQSIRPMPILSESRALCIDLFDIVKTVKAQDITIACYEVELTVSIQYNNKEEKDEYNIGRVIFSLEVQEELKRSKLTKNKSSRNNRNSNSSKEELEDDVVVEETSNEGKNQSKKLILVLKISSVRHLSADSALGSADSVRHCRISTKSAP